MDPRREVRATKADALRMIRANGCTVRHTSQPDEWDTRAVATALIFACSVLVIVAAILHPM